MRYWVAVCLLLTGCSAEVGDDADMSIDIAPDLGDMPDGVGADSGTDAFVPPPDPCQEWVFGPGAPPFRIEDGFIFEGAVEAITDQISFWYTQSGPGSGGSRVAAVDTLILPARPREVFDWVVYTEGDDALKLVVGNAPNKYGPFWVYLFVERGFEPVPFKITLLYPDTGIIQGSGPAIWRQAKNDYMIYLLELPAPDSPGIEPVVIDSRIIFESGGGFGYNHSFAHYHEMTEPPDFKVCAKRLKFRDTDVSYSKGIYVQRVGGEPWIPDQEPWKVRLGEPLVLQIDTGFGSLNDVEWVPRFMSYSLYDFGRSRLHGWKVRWGEAAREPPNTTVFRHREYVTLRFDEVGVHRLQAIGYEDPFSADRTFLSPRREVSWMIEVEVVE